jgi:hypothetical protein
MEREGNAVLICSFDVQISFDWKFNSRLVGFRGTGGGRFFLNSPVGFLGTGGGFLLGFTDC